MKWLEELKERPDEAAWNQRGVMPRGLPHEEFDRLIEIAERAEFAVLPIDPDYTNGCTICQTEYDYVKGDDGEWVDVMKHSDDCPYSDEWRP